MATTREQLHELVDDLPDDRLDAVKTMIVALTDPVLAAFLAAPEDDEPTTAEDLAAIAEGNAAAAHGESVPLAEVMASLNGHA
jgi:predicted transcriptional regulator